VSFGTVLRLGSRDIHQRDKGNTSVLAKPVKIG
jgi:hypothetical protein